MEILYYPPWDDGDYQDFLYSALENCGAKSTGASNHPLLPILINRHQIDRADIFHVHWIHTLYGGSSKWMPILVILLLPQLLYLRIAETPVVWTVHNHTTHDTPYPRLDVLVRRIFARFICGGIIVHCDSARTTIKETYGLRSDSRISVIPHGNYDPYPRNTGKDPGVEINVPDEGFCYLQFGSIKPYKGTLELVEAFSSIAESEDRLLIMGRRSNERYARELETAVHDDDRIKLEFGYVENKTFHSIAEIADAMVLPYRDILTSGAAHLALSFGMPVVAPRIGCLPETVPEKGGVLYTSGGLGDAMKAVKRLDPEQVADSATKAMQQQSWDFIASETKKTYQTYLTHRIPIRE